MVCDFSYVKQGAGLQWWKHGRLFICHFSKLFFYSQLTATLAGESLSPVFFSPSSVVFFLPRENVKKMSCIVHKINTKHFFSPASVFVARKLLKNVWKAFSTESVHIHKSKLQAARDEWSLKFSWIFNARFHQAVLRSKHFSPGSVAAFEMYFMDGEIDKKIHSLNKPFVEKCWGRKKFQTKTISR